MQHLKCPESLYDSPPLPDPRGWVKYCSTVPRQSSRLRRHQQHFGAAREAGVSVAREAAVKPQEVHTYENMLADPM